MKSKVIAVPMKKMQEEYDIESDDVTPATWDETGDTDTTQKVTIKKETVQELIETSRIKIKKRNVRRKPEVERFSSFATGFDARSLKSHFPKFKS